MRDVEAEQWFDVESEQSGLAKGAWVSASLHLPRPEAA